MKYQDKNMDSDWAKEVPDARFRGPYEDYGWDSGDSVLPEFRDPSIHLTPYERQELRRELTRRGESLTPFDRRWLRRSQRGTGEMNRYGRREMPDHEKAEYGWSQYYGQPFSRGYAGEEYRGEREAWMRQGPFSGRGPRNYKRSDDRIYEDICQRLTAHGQIDPSDIQIEVHDGEVTLHGTVDSRRTKRMVEDTVDTVSGVQDVSNGLTVEQRRPDQSST